MKLCVLFEMPKIVSGSHSGQRTKMVNEQNLLGEKWRKHEREQSQSEINSLQIASADSFASFHFAASFGTQKFTSRLVQHFGKIRCILKIFRTERNSSFVKLQLRFYLGPNSSFQADNLWTYMSWFDDCKIIPVVFFGNVSRFVFQIRTVVPGGTVDFEDLCDAVFLNDVLLAMYVEPSSSFSQLSIVPSHSQITLTLRTT